MDLDAIYQRLDVKRVTGCRRNDGRWHVRLQSPRAHYTGTGATLRDAEIDAVAFVDAPPLTEPFADDEAGLL